MRRIAFWLVADDSACRGCRSGQHECLGRGLERGSRKQHASPSDMKAAMGRCLRCIVIPRIAPTNPPDTTSTPQQNAHSIPLIPSGIRVLLLVVARVYPAGSLYETPLSSADCHLSTIRTRHCLSR